MRLEIKELGIDVPVIRASGKNTQEIIDRPNAAVYMHWYTQDAIADHASQSNFKNLNNANAGKTMAVLYDDAKPRKLICTKSQIGHIRISPKGNRIFDQNWESLYHKNKGGICIYTCIAKSAKDVMDVRVTYWQDC